MNRNLRIMLAAVALAAAAGVAWATPYVGLVSPIVASGSHDGEVQVKGSGTAANGLPFRIELEADGPATLSTQFGSIAAAGHNGWHSHPGMVVVTLVAGSIRWYDENCIPTDHKAGDSWIEGSTPHAYLVTSTTPIQLVAWFVTARGKPLRTDLPAPGCAAGLGL
jgi:quercetin dioxygenase-like cupin family protein